MDKTFVYGALRQVERDVVEGEKDSTAAEAELDTMRRAQRILDQDRQRLLSLLQP
ncbi:hypothetical protein I6F14_09035 [Bradyrhizobium sp. IC3069]|uniref:hypothetical protein n=1 Tax=Bradyrhizobium TaxID=374 RepID=UPI001CD5F0C2|nr:MULTISPECIES: hypothetical protein [Bradyrhizobium]MCA1361026.1 hypothetical protein [Bradyrhizobium sp. IC4059]MCA1378780.1 hypothetical protein [Bradyrhizobium sp. IC4060]MCA1411441.1 hypothetical protein [Bradyrhizobium sp. NBAIM20]MCA1460697.1 hypothetical protein [Bradyrhizobium sp. NBAIM18]MCA1487770.1 hypothetical protein [Bradyrhizobium sp. IC4061]